MKTRVLIVDDHTSVRQMLRFLIPRAGDFDVVGDASSGIKAMRLHRELKPDLVVLDLALAELNGAGVLQQLREEARETRTLVFCGTTHPELIMAALRAQPHGFVSKWDSWDTFVKALQIVNEGSTFFSSFATRALDEARSEDQKPRLTHREMAILQMIAESHTNKVIAEKLALSVKTVEHHRSNIMSKLDMHDVAGLTRYASREGLISNLARPKSLS